MSNGESVGTIHLDLVLNSKLNEIQKEAEKVTPKLKSSFNKIEKMGNAVNKKLNNAFDGKYISDKMEKSCERANNSLNIVTSGALKMQKSLNSTERAQARLDKLQERLNKLASGEIAPNAVKTLETELNKALKQFQTLETEIDKMSSKQSEIAKKPNYQRTTKDKNLFSNLDKSIIEKGYEMDAIEDRINVLQKKLSNLKASPQLSDEFNECAKQIDIAKGRLIAMQMQEQKVNLETQSIGGQMTAAFSAVDAAISATGIGMILVVISKVVAAIRSMVNYVKGVVNNAIERGKSIVSTVKNVGLSIGDLSVKTINVFRKMAKYTGGFASAVKNSLATVLGFKAIGSIVSPVKKAGTEMTKFLKAATIFEIVKKAYSKMVDSVKAGFGNLVGYDKKFALSVAQLKDKVTTLQNSLTAAFKPVYSFVIPKITAVVNWLQKASDSVAQFIAALMGKSTYTKANAITKTADDLNKLEGGLASFDEINNLNSSEDYTKMFETAEVETKISEFFNKIKEMWEKADFTMLGKSLSDKINDALKAIEWDKIKNTATNIGSSIATFLNGMFGNRDLAETIGGTLSGIFNAALDLLYKFLEKFNFAEFGIFLAKAFTKLIEKINWNGLADVLVFYFMGIFTTLKNFLKNVDFKELGDKLGSTFNRIVSGIEWGFIGKTLGIQINSLINLIKGFLNEYDWGSIGRALSTLINMAVITISWAEFGKTVNDGITAILTEVYIFIAGLNTAAISNAINTFIKNINFKEVFETFGDCLKRTFGQLNSFVDNVDWAEIGRAVGRAVAGIDIAGVVTGAVKFASSVWNAIAEAITNYNFTFSGGASGAIGKKLANTVNNVLENTNFKEMAAGISEFVNNIINQVCDFFDNLDTEELNTAISNFFGNININFDKLINSFANLMMQVDWSPVTNLAADMVWSSFKLSCLKTIIKIKNFFSGTFGKAIMDGINIALGLTNPLLLGIKKLCDFIIDNFKEIFGIHSPSKVMETIGTFLVQGLINGLGNLKDKLIQVCSNIYNTVVESFKEIANNARSAVNSAFEDIGTWFSNRYEDIKNVFANIKDWFKEKFTEAYIAVTEAFSNIKTFFENLWNSIKNTFTDLGTKIGDAIGGAFKSVINSVLKFCGDKINSLIEDINKFIPYINKIPGVHLNNIRKLEIPQFATGGIITQPTLAMVGERGKEAVMPLENNTGWINELAGKISTIMMSYQSGSGSNNNVPIYIELNIGGTKFGKVCIDNINKYQRKMGKVILEV